MTWSSGATTTATPANSGTARKARKVWSMIRDPASTSYCLGRSSPERLPLPAQGISA